MKHWHVALFLVLSTAFLTCGNNKKTELVAQQQLRDEVMVIHDEVMPMMGELTSLAGQLKQIVHGDSTLSAEWQTEISQTVEKMAQAD